MRRLLFTEAKIGWRAQGGLHRTEMSRNTFLFSTTNVGQAVGEGTSKYKLVDSSTDGRQSRSLYVIDMTGVRFGNGTDQRNRFIANVRGFKIQIYARNITAQPLSMNYAILAGRSKNSISSNDIFRSQTGDKRADGFSGRTGPQVAYANINTDEYVCLYHRRLWLAEGKDEDNNGPWFTKYTSPNWFSKEFYLPIDRQLRWESQEADSCTEKIFLVFWFTEMENIVPSAAAITTHAITCYFKDTKN